MTDMLKIRQLAAHYRGLQGLRMLPVSLWILAFGAVNPIMGLPQGRLDYQCLLLVPGLAVVFVLTALVGNYYDRTFGWVKKLPPRNRLLEVLGVAAFLGITYIGIMIDGMRRLPISVVGLIFAATYLIGWWMMDRLPIHYVVTAAILVVLSLLPLTGLPANGHWFDLLGGSISTIILGITMIVNSLLGHMVLVRNLENLAQVEP